MNDALFHFDVGPKSLNSSENVYIRQKSHPEFISSCWFWLPPILNCTVMALFSAWAMGLTNHYWYRGSSYIIWYVLTVRYGRYLSSYHVLIKSSYSVPKHFSADLRSLYPNVFHFWGWSECPIQFCESPSTVHPTLIRATLGNIANYYLFQSQCPTVKKPS